VKNNRVVVPDAAFNTRSIAVSLLIGYVLGLGDRHPEKILFSESMP
jgi:hypothetical protein